MSSLLTGELVLRSAYDQEKEALKTVPAEETQFAVSLDREEGDSVYSYAPTVALEPDTEYSAVGYRRICLYAVGTLEVSHTETGDNFQTIATTPLQVVEICAVRVKSSAAAVMSS